jgi:hypothetical protein
VCGAAEKMLPLIFTAFKGMAATIDQKRTVLQGYIQGNALPNVYSPKNVLENVLEVFRYQEQQATSDAKSTALKSELRQRITSMSLSRR